MSQWRNAVNEVTSLQVAYGAGNILKLIIYCDKTYAIEISTALTRSTCSMFKCPTEAEPRTKHALHGSRHQPMSRNVRNGPGIKLTFHSLWGSASNSHLEILEIFQSKVLRMLTNAPWFVPNTIIRNDLRVPTVRQEARKESPTGSGLQTIAFTAWTGTTLPFIPFLSHFMLPFEQTCLQPTDGFLS
jgi:hypothetical protein